ncbi:hypothetical protein ON010_g8458 [Phytophthora cinnamomi]|nr:hypothetical protein ON010_g8458 [Phytophthora cinnamomi]
MFAAETHVNADEIEHMQKAYATRWGHRTGRGCSTLSYWGAANDSKGGVGVLIKPYGSFTDVHPLWSDAWSPHLVAVTGTLDHKEFAIVDIYAPIDRVQREKLFGISANYLSLLVAESPDRATHDSAELRLLLEAWGARDCLTYAMPSLDDQERLHKFHRHHHTYRYKVHDEHETSRLDRWYSTTSAHPWIAAVDVVQPAAKADHDGVLLHLRSPTNALRVNKPPRTYPVPDYAASTVDACTRGILDALYDRITEEVPTAEEAVELWETAKRDVFLGTRRCMRQARRRLKRTYRQKLARLLRQLRAALHDDRCGADEMDSITARLDALTLEDTGRGTRVDKIKRAIAELGMERGMKKMKRLFQKRAWHEGKTTRPLFQSTSTKFTDNAVPTLVPKEGLPRRGVHDKANTFAGAWTTIFNQSEASIGNIDVALEWTKQHRVVDDLQDAVAAALTEADVAAAVDACDAGKACGPETLGNDWYQDFKELLVPILTILFNIWYKAGIFPPTFLEADIFCLKKKGDLSNPLNYRPLALLNSDYKTFTRILATRVSKSLPARIHSHQKGFVPGRQIHDTIDLFTAAQHMANVDDEQREALAVLLDFHKAYDSLGRRFLIRALEAHGYPPQFVRAIYQLHEGTRVRFLVNGTRSKLRAAGREIELRVGGYADDTAAYLTSPNDIPHLLDITRKFSIASGLNVNEAKTVVIALHSQGPPQSARLPGCLAFQADQRATVAAAIIIPKITFVARHAWPTATQVLNLQSRIRNVVWFGDFDEAGPFGRAWVAADIANLPRRHGGIAIPQARLELLALAATEVDRWALTSDDTMLVVGDLLHHPGRIDDSASYVSVSHSDRTPMTGHFPPSLWTAGKTMLASAGIDQQFPPHTPLLVQLFYTI